MKDKIREEIKDILKNFSNNNLFEEYGSPRTKWFYLKKEETDLLLDYITNLQEENKKLKEELQQEKKDFKEANDYCFELKDYKSRNEKAVEIYKNRNTCKYKKERFMKDKSTSDLMYETLTGGDKDVKN